MSQLVVLKLGFGSWQQGFPAVIAQIGTDKEPYQKQLTASLPPAPDLPELYRHWQLFYLALYERLGEQFRITFDETEEIPTNVSAAEFDQLCQKLRIHFNAWLNSLEFRPIYQKLWRDFSPEAEIRLLIETDDPQLRQFPWHLWDFLRDYPNAEVALSNPKHERVKIRSCNSSEQVRILAILGNSQELDLEKDRAILQELAGSKPTFIVKPSRKDISDQLWRHNWDIFFFAGHSCSQIEQAKGQMALDEFQNLTIGDMHNALSHAIAEGLQIAIFNSCQGLGLVQELENLELYIPQIIVMREAVPDRVAQVFLTYFLEALAQGESFYLAVRKAREHLQSLEDEFPCASWLPVICQNPAVVPPTWESLRRIKRQKLQPAFWASLVATGLVVTMRSLGILQGLELETFDQMLRLRPTEGIDERILLITIDEADIQNQSAEELGGASLSDRALDKLLAKLDKSQATAIGLDIYRPNPLGEAYQDLAKWMKESDRFFAICKYGNPGVSPPGEVSAQHQGFNNIVLDGDGILRRNLLAVESAQPCQNPYAFSLQLAKRHIAVIDANREFIPKNTDGYIQLGETVFKTLEKQVGGYFNLDNRGHQILINYRNSPEIAEKISLTEFLATYPPEKVGKRIVLIGTIAPSFNDHRWYIPLKQVTGLEIQANLASQILSTVLDHRPLIWVWSYWGEILWIWGWSGIGGILVCKFQSPGKRLLGQGLALIILSGSCWGLFQFGGWIPLVPPILALVISGGIILVYKELSSINIYHFIRMVLNTSTRNQKFMTYLFSRLKVFIKERNNER